MAHSEVRFRSLLVMSRWRDDSAVVLILKFLFNQQCQTNADLNSGKTLIVKIQPAEDEIERRWEGINQTLFCIF